MIQNQFTVSKPWFRHITVMQWNSRVVPAMTMMMMMRTTRGCQDAKTLVSISHLRSIFHSVSRSPVETTSIILKHPDSLKQPVGQIRRSCFSRVWRPKITLLFGCEAHPPPSVLALIGQVPTWRICCWQTNFFISVLNHISISSALDQCLRYYVTLIVGHAGFQF